MMLVETRRFRLDGCMERFIDRFSCYEAVLMVELKVVMGRDGHGRRGYP